MSKINPDPEEQLTLDDKIIEQLKHDTDEDAAIDPLEMFAARD